MRPTVVIVAGPDGFDDLGARAYVVAVDWARCERCGGHQTTRHESDGWCELNQSLRRLRDRARAMETPEQKIEHYRREFADYVSKLEAAT